MVKMMIESVSNKGVSALFERFTHHLWGKNIFRIILSFRTKILTFLFITASPFLYAGDDIRVLFTGIHIFDDNIVFSINIRNRRDNNIYILLDYTLQKIEYQENMKTIFATLSSEPHPLKYDSYYPSHFVMPNFNIVAPEQEQLFHIIIKENKYNLKKNTSVMRTVIKGLRYFITEPPGYGFWGTMVGSYSYELYSNFYRMNVYSFDSIDLFWGG